jgi:NADH-quinone oxidoreductase subunit F
MNNMSELRAKCKERYEKKLSRPRVVVGLGTCGIASGGDRVMKAIKEEVAAKGLDVDIDFTSCIGMCYREPMVEVAIPGMPSVVYGDIYPDKVPQLLESHVVNKTPVYEWASHPNPGRRHSLRGYRYYGKGPLL